MNFILSFTCDGKCLQHSCRYFPINVLTPLTNQKRISGIFVNLGMHINTRNNCQTTCVWKEDYSTRGLSQPSPSSLIPLAALIHDAEITGIWAEESVRALDLFRMDIFFSFSFYFHITKEMGLKIEILYCIVPLVSGGHSHSFISTVHM